jgi:hypothetical protein
MIFLLLDMAGGAWYLTKLLWNDDFVRSQWAVSNRTGSNSVLPIYHDTPSSFKKPHKKK